MINQIKVRDKWNAHGLGVSSYCQMMNDQIEWIIISKCETPFYELLLQVGARNGLHRQTLNNRKHPFF